MPKPTNRPLVRPLTPADRLAGAVEGAAPRADPATLVAIAALAYLLEVGLHEHGGHSLACVLTGGWPAEMGAFYVDCRGLAVGSSAARVVDLAGPVASLLLGTAGFAVLRGLSRAAATTRYFVWLLASLGLMSTSGYFLLSGATGIGDLGTTADGAFHGLGPEWLIRPALFAVGVLSYRWVVGVMRRTLLAQMGPDRRGEGALARRLTLVSYCAGALVYLAIGLFNPRGLEILIVSVLPSSLGGSCGLLLIRRHFSLPVASVPGTGVAPGSAPAAPSGMPRGASAGLGFARNRGWIVAGAAFTLAYGLILGPTLHP